MNDVSAKTGGSYKTVEGLRRGLALMRALNNLPTGASPTQLATLTGLHRTTVRRLLETLQLEGCVQYNPRSESFQLAPGCRDLSEGYRDEHWVSSLAAPLMMELLNKIPWPADLTSLDGDALIIRESTHRYSRLSFHRAMVGRRLPLTMTAAGRAYLAWCPDEERRELLRLIIHREANPGESLERFKRRIDTELRKVRRFGYGWNEGSWNEQSRFSAIAVPIHGEGKLQGVLSTVFPSNAMTPAQAAEKHLQILKDCAAEISMALSNTSG